MIIGLPKEVKDNENRVGLIPGAVRALTRRGHTVLVESGAGLGSAIDDAEYQEAGATIVPDAAAAWAAEMVVKVKEPIAGEYGFLRDDLVLFTYLHLAADRPLTEELLRQGTTAIAYETVTERGRLPLLTPMSEVAGRMASQVGASGCALAMAASVALGFGSVAASEASALSMVGSSPSTMSSAP